MSYEASGRIGSGDIVSFKFPCRQGAHPKGGHAWCLKPPAQKYAWRSGRHLAGGRMPGWR